MGLLLAVCNKQLSNLILGHNGLRSTPNMSQEAQRGNRGVALLILNTDATYGRVDNATHPWGRAPTLIIEEAGWILGLVGMCME